MVFGLRFGEKKDTVNVVIVTGSCCMPGMAPLDERAQAMVARAVEETGVRAKVKLMPATTAALGGVPRQLVARFMSTFEKEGRIALPAVLVDGSPVAMGVPDPGELREALLKAAGNHAEQEETHHG